MSDEGPPELSELRELGGEAFSAYSENGEVSEDTRDEMGEMIAADPLMRDMISEVYHRKWVEEELVGDMNLSQIHMTVKNLMLISCVNDDREIEKYLENERIKKTYENVKMDFEEGCISDDLRETHRENIQPVLNEIDMRKENKREKLFGEKYKEIKELERSERDDSDEIINKIKKGRKIPKYQQLWEDIEKLENIENSVKRFPYSEIDLNTEYPKMEKDPDRHLKLLAIKIHKPRIYTTLHHFENEYDDYPLRWLQLSMGINRRAYNAFKNGNLPESIITGRVDRDGYLDDFLDEIEKLPPYRERMDIMSEVSENYKDGRYASAISVILPQIEYMMWQYAAYLDSNHDTDIILGADYTSYWDFNVRDHNDLMIKTVDGKSTKPRIGDLVRLTEMSEHLRPELVEYFGEEIFSNRNPILHGNSSDYHSKLEAAKKIVFFRHIVEEMVDKITEQFANDLSDSGRLNELEFPDGYKEMREDN